MSNLLPEKMVDPLEETGITNRGSNGGIADGNQDSVHLEVARVAPVKISQLEKQLLTSFGSSEADRSDGDAEACGGEGDEGIQYTSGYVKGGSSNKLVQRKFNLSGSPRGNQLKSPPDRKPYHAPSQHSPKPEEKYALMNLINSEGCVQLSGRFHSTCQTAGPAKFPAYLTTSARKSDSPESGILPLNTEDLNHQSNLFTVVPKIPANPPLSYPTLNLSLMDEERNLKNSKNLLNGNAPQSTQEVPVSTVLWTRRFTGSLSPASTLAEEIETKPKKINLVADCNWRREYSFEREGRSFGNLRTAVFRSPSSTPSSEHGNVSSPPNSSHESPFKRRLNQIFSPLRITVAEDKIETAMAKANRCFQKKTAEFKCLTECAAHKLEEKVRSLTLNNPMQNTAIGSEFPHHVNLESCSFDRTTGQSLRPLKSLTTSQSISEEKSSAPSLSSSSSNEESRQPTLVISPSTTQNVSMLLDSKITTPTSAEEPDMQRPEQNSVANANQQTETLSEQASAALASKRSLRQPLQLQNSAPPSQNGLSLPSPTTRRLQVIERTSRKPIGALTKQNQRPSRSRTRINDSAKLNEQRTMAESYSVNLQTSRRDKLAECASPLPQLENCEKVVVNNETTNQAVYPVEQTFEACREEADSASNEVVNTATIAATAETDHASEKLMSKAQHPSDPILFPVGYKIAD